MNELPSAKLSSESVTHQLPQSDTWSF